MSCKLWSIPFCVYNNIFWSCEHYRRYFSNEFMVPIWEKLLRMVHLYAVALMVTLNKPGLFTAIFKP